MIWKVKEFIVYQNINDLVLHPRFIIDKLADLKQVICKVAIIQYLVCLAHRIFINIK